MSLINDMLRDLEARRPEGGRDALNGVSAVPRPRRGRWLAVAGVVLVAVAGAAVVWAAYRPADEPAPVGVADEPERLEGQSVAGSADGAQASRPSEAAEPGETEPSPTPRRRIETVGLSAAEDGMELVMGSDQRLAFRLQRLDGGEHLRLVLPEAVLDTDFPDLAARSPYIRTVSLGPGEAGLTLDLWLAEGVRSQANTGDGGRSVVLRLTGPATAARSPDSTGAPQASVKASREAAVETGQDAADNDNKAKQGAIEAQSPAVPAGDEASPGTADAGFRKSRSEGGGASVSRLVAQGRARLDDGDAAGAVALLRQALDQDAGAHPARTLLARAYAATGRLSAAVSVLEQGLLVDPQHTPFLLQLARLLAGAGQTGTALDVLQRRAPEQPGGEYHALRGALSQRLGQYDEAAAAYRQAVRAAPQRGGWWVGLGIALEGQGRPEDALESYRAGLSRGDLKPALRRYAQQRLQRLAQ